MISKKYKRKITKEKENKDNGKEKKNCGRRREKRRYKK